MELREYSEQALERCADRFYARWPQAAPSLERLAACKLVSHRGEHDNRRVLENTLAAFDRVVEAGVWGMELDVRWTTDHVPMVFHDADLKRLFDAPQRIEQMMSHTVASRFSTIPTLSSVIERYGRRVHLMIELKRPPTRRQADNLKQLLAALTPREDYHLIALNTAILRPMDTIIPRKALVPIAGYRCAHLARWVTRHQWGGVCAHYLLISQATISGLKKNGRCVGTGYARSRNSLFRELNRGCDWIFTNIAATLQGYVGDEIRDRTTL